MIRGIKIKQIVMLMAWMVLLLHAVVPHHHHIDCSGINEDSILTSSNLNNDCADGDLSHCHALNNLDIELTDTAVLGSIPLLKILFNSIISSTLTEVTNTSINIESTSVSNLVIPKQYFLSQFTFRGPPSLTYTTENI